MIFPYFSDVTLSVADTTSSTTVTTTPGQPDLEESLNLPSVKKLPTKVVNVEVHDESSSNFVTKNRKELDNSAIVTSPEISKVTNASQDAIGKFAEFATYLLEYGKEFSLVWTFSF